MVAQKMETTSKAKLESNKNLIKSFKVRIRGASDLRGDVSSRVSARVTKTAPATKAAGAPMALVHSQASKAVAVLSKTVPANSMPKYSLLLLDDDDDDDV